MHGGANFSWLGVVSQAGHIVPVPGPRFQVYVLGSAALVGVQTLQFQQHVYVRQLMYVLPPQRHLS